MIQSSRCKAVGTELKGAVGYVKELSREIAAPETLADQEHVSKRCTAQKLQEDWGEAYTNAFVTENSFADRECPIF